jgi:uncharacterized protein YeaO (DUF488 family)
MRFCEIWKEQIAPSPELRKWYGHETSRWDEFRRRYLAEIEDNNELLNDLKRRLKDGPVTFVYAARDESHNSALVLKEHLEGAT